MSVHANIWRMMLSAAELDALKPAFDKWLTAKARPETVYDKMPIAAEKEFTTDIENNAARWQVLCDKLVQWLHYVQAFTVKESYDMRHAISLLVEKRGKDEVALLLHWLHVEDENWVSVLAKKLQGMLGLVYPDTVETMIGLWHKSGKDSKVV